MDFQPLKAAFSRSNQPDNHQPDPQQNNARPFREHRDSEVIYQVYPASFNDADGDGHGDLRGITEKLPYIKSLNVDAVWISPFYKAPEGPEGDGGYAVSDYRGIAAKFGDDRDFKTLLTEAHRHGLRVYIDFVLCHTAHDHDWFRQSRENRENPKADWYVWHDGGRDGHGNRLPPNNWKSVFGGPAWTFDNTRGQWYMHHFLKSQPALNLNSPKVQDAILDEMRYWLDLGVDGFRFDALPFATHDTQFRNNPWLDGQWPRAFENWSDQYFAHSICQPETVDLVSRIRALLDSYPGKRTGLGEAIAGPRGGAESIPLAASYVDRDRGLDHCYTEALMSLYEYPSAARMKDMVRRIESAFATGGNCNSSSNHDMPRAATRMTANLPEQDRAAAAAQLLRLFVTMPGSFCMYQGEELGLPQARLFEDIPESSIRDAVYWTKGPNDCRDGERTPMPWSAAQPNAGFSPSADPYLPVPGSHYPLSVDRQESNPSSMLNKTRALLSWRRAQPALVSGETIALDAPDPVLAFIRRHKDQTLLCLYNMSGQARRVTPASFIGADLCAELGLSAQEEMTLGAYDAAYKGGRTAQPAPVPKTALRNRF